MVQITPILKTMQAQTKEMVPVKDLQNKNYLKFIGMAQKYEDSNLRVYSNQQESKFIISDTFHQNVRDQLEETLGSLQNPFEKFYIWVKGEIMDIQAMQESIESRDALKKLANSIQSKQKEDQATLDKLNQGKKTFKTLFKSSGSRQIEITNLNNAIAAAERDTELYQKIVNILDIYLAETQVQEFKDEKVDTYYRMIKQFCTFEVTNSHASASFWNGVLSNTNLKHF